MTKPEIGYRTRYQLRGLFKPKMRNNPFGIFLLFVFFFFVVCLTLVLLVVKFFDLALALVPLADWCVGLGVVQYVVG